LLYKKIKTKIHRTIIFLLVLFGCDTLSLTTSEEHRLRVFKYRVLKRLFGPKRYKVTGEWRKLHNEELNGLYSLPNIVWVVKLRKMRWVGHIASMGEVHTGFWLGKLRKRDHLEDSGIDGRIKLIWIFRKWDRRHGLD